MAKSRVPKWLRDLIAERGVHTPGQPIVPNARHVVSCPCGFAHDSAAKTEAEALAEFQGAHRCGAGVQLYVESVDYTEHPLYRGIHGKEIRRERDARARPAQDSRP